MAGFATLKRDLVQLAGLLANDDQQTQDQIRECGGMQVILSMCVTDDRNPRKFEHRLHFLYRHANIPKSDTRIRLARRAKSDDQQCRESSGHPGDGSRRDRRT